jgi:hypothetical protein
MDLLDVIITILECIAIGFGMEVGAVVAKVVAVRMLNSSSPVAVHDVEDEDEDEEEEKSKRRRQRRARGQGGPSTPAAVRVM